MSTFDELSLIIKEIETKIAEVGPDEVEWSNISRFCSQFAFVSVLKKNVASLAPYWQDAKEELKAIFLPHEVDAFDKKITNLIAQAGSESEPITGFRL